MAASMLDIPAPMQSQGPDGVDAAVGLIDPGVSCVTESILKSKWYYDYYCVHVTRFLAPFLRRRLER